MPSCGVPRRHFLGLGAAFVMAPPRATAATSGPAPPLRPAANGSPVGEILAAFADGRDRFACEAQWRQLQPAVAHLRAALRSGGAELGALLAPGAACRVAPLGWRPATDTGWARVRSADPGHWGGPAAFAAWLRPHAPLREAELECVAIAASGSGRLRTRLRLSLAAREPWQASGEWDIEWGRPAETGRWRIERWGTDSLTTAESPGFAFEDITASAFGNDPSYRRQLLRDTNYWRTVLDAAAGVDIFGNYGVAVGDADGDGEDEIYVCQPQGLPNRLYRRRRGSGGLEYEDISATAGVDLLDATSMALFADLRNRGRQDLILITQSQPLVFWNEGGGRFRVDGEAIPLRQGGASLTGAALADYDGDGFLDLYVCSYGYFQGSGANPLPRPYFNARNGPPNHLYRNQGDGRFRDATEASGLNQGNDRYSFSCAWTGWNDQPHPDLLVINDFGEDNYYRNRGDGTFEEIADGLRGHGAGMSVAVADFARRGLQPYVGNMWTPAGLRVTADAGFQTRYPAAAAEAMRQMAEGNRLYAPPPTPATPLTPVPSGAERAGWAWSCDSLDVANRGRPDLYCVNGFLSAPDGAGRPSLNSFFWQQIIARAPASARERLSAGYAAGWQAGFELAHRDHDWYGRQRNVCFLNLGGGQFADVSALSGLDFEADGRAFAVLDADGDGHNDLLVRSRTGPQLRLLRNRAGAGHPSLAVRVHGVRGNRDAIGARITLTSMAGREVRELRAGSGFLSQHSKRLVFGLGEAEQGDVRVEWPGGGITEYSGLKAGFTYELTEGQEQPWRVPFGPAPQTPAAPARAEAIPARFITHLVDPLPLPRLTELGLGAGAAAASLLWLCRLGDATAQGLPGAAAVEWGRAPAPFRAFCSAVLAYLYDRRRAVTLPTGLQVAQGRLVQVFWGGATRAELGAALRQPPASGAAALPFSGRSLLCSYRRDLRQLGAALETAGLHAPAALYLQSAAEMFPQDAEVFYNLGLARRGAGQPQPAEAAAAQALALRPDFAEAENLLGVLAMDRGDWSDASRRFQLATTQAPEDASAWNNLGYAQLRQGDLTAAGQSLARALGLAPDFADALNNRGIWAARQGHLSAAAKDFGRAVAADPDDEQAANNLAVLQARQGHAAAASATLESLLRRHPDAR
ncbi:MAG: FG-GAP-like repeat-containing protein, partial [Terriglobales bacterium]